MVRQFLERGGDIYLSYVQYNTSGPFPLSSSGRCPHILPLSGFAVGFPSQSSSFNLLAFDIQSCAECPESKMNLYLPL